jgi:hypothetical protein
MQNSNVLIFDGKAYATQIVREIDSDEFLKLISQGQPVSDDALPLPEHCRWFFKTDYTLNFVIELKPAILPIKHVNWRRAYKVAFPWQYFVLSFTRDAPTNSYWHMGNPHLGWSQNRIYSLTEYGLSRPDLPNVYEDGYDICVGTTAPESTLPPEERVTEFISGFFSEGSQFNDDLDWHYPGEYTSIAEWARDSKANSRCWMNWRMRGSGSLRDMFTTVTQYDRAGNLITPIQNLADLTDRAQYVGRRPW